MDEQPYTKRCPYCREVGLFFRKSDIPRWESEDEPLITCRLCGTAMPVFGNVMGTVQYWFERHG